MVTQLTFPEVTPYIEYETSIYGRLSGEEDDGTMGEESYIRV